MGLWHLDVACAPCAAESLGNPLSRALASQCESLGSDRLRPEMQRKTETGTAGRQAGILRGERATAILQDPGSWSRIDDGRRGSGMAREHGRRFDNGSGPGGAFVSSLKKRGRLAWADSKRNASADSAPACRQVEWRLQL
ncbi:uncharacterized protein K452DRAFT_143464 [Aplosporella prunicola CBS 121167]|uniref:Uncharacterized protein n=1 Tax=Aplosporella prunicola CBS 121167 TaxID=1176127 RepID=A0A6A6BK74_9PEZI|nr:uncharacterized protein K452DRAFT_143464 [Aplosporella prunicola CBS 121167]KAF2144540.1 hypothetical protein K452DRAFT_143464 [Aplosporella prunicola CBS 121167]